MNPARQFLKTVPANYLSLADIHLRLHLRLHLANAPYVPVPEWPVNSATVESQIPSNEAHWEIFWRQLHRIRVRKLVVEVIDVGFKAREEQLLEALKYVHADSIEVVLPWPTGRWMAGKFQDAAFIVRRPPEGVEPFLPGLWGTWPPEPRCRRRAVRRRRRAVGGDHSGNVWKAG
jgi:hypothetical protein